MQISELARAGLLQLPTPLEPLERLRAAVASPCPLWVKRDDATQVGLGGNKTRKLEYVAAEARAAGADTLITWGGVQSNHCRQTAAYAAKMGLDCHLILNGPADTPRQGNVLLFTLYGARIHFERAEERCWDACLSLAESLRKAGRKPYCIPIGASTPVGIAGYVECAAEILRQAADKGLRVTDVFLPTGTGGTQAGLILGFHGTGVRTHGISVSSPAEKQRGKVLTILRAAAEAFPGQTAFAPEEILVDDRFVGPGYAVPSPEGNAAVRLAGRTEALTLDPVYTGKALAGMLAWLKTADAKNACAVFLHTGGAPAIFRFAAEMGLAQE